MNEGLLIMIVPLLMLIFAWTSVTYWISARAAERRMRERYALLKHLSERPAESVQLVLEQLRQDDAREEQRQRARAGVMRRGKLEGAFILLAAGGALGLFLRNLVPAAPFWMIGLLPALIGVVLAISTWFEPRTEHR